jgi:hypothetical protein
MVMKVGDLVYIRWEDSQGCPQGWQHVSDVPLDAAISQIETVGWVIAMSKRAVQVAPHRSSHRGEPGCVQGYVAIPRSGFLKSKVLKLTA